MIQFNQSDRHRYDDIIDLPHHVSRTHPGMPAKDRAAQFAPFAALTGHGEAVKETSRLTERRIELDESAKAALDEKLRVIRSRLDIHPSAAITYFVPDGRKAGGAYEKAAGQVIGIDGYERVLFLEDETKIPIAEIIEIESPDIGI